MRRSPAFRLALAIACAALVAAAVGVVSPGDSLAQGARSQRARPPASARTTERRVRVQYKGVALQRVIREIGEATGTRFVFGDDVRGVITIAVPKPVGVPEALELLRAALFIKGYAQVPAGGDAYKIVPITQTATDTEFVARELDDESERAITTLVSLEHVSVEQVAETIKPLAPSNGAVVAYEPTNSIILSGTEAALGRLITVVRMLDAAAEEQLWSRVIRHRTVTEVIAAADVALNDGWSEANQIELFSDERTNLLLARGPRERLDALRDFIDEFDRFEPGSGTLHVVRVLNRDPDEIVEIIGALQAGRSRVRGRDRASEPPREAGGGEGDGGPDASAPLPTSETARSLEGLQFSLTSDAPSRSIIIQAARAEAQLVADMIGELDKIAPRVAVEVSFFEIQKPSSFLWSLDFIGTVNPGGSDDGAIRVQSIPGSGTTERDPENAGLFGRVAGPPLQVPVENPITGETQVLEFPANEAAVNASETGTTVALLSRPNLTVMAGDEHELFVGNNVPIPVSSNPSTTVTNEDGTTSAAVVNPLLQQQTIEREDVGMTLRIRPTVGEEGFVELQLTLEFSEVVPSAVGVPASEVGVTIAQRKIESTSVLRPGQYAILAMAEERATREGRFGVPWLMDIPGLGLLFSRIEQRVVDTRIIVAARARVLRSPADDVAESIRRRLAFERSISRVNDIEKIPDRPWAVRLATFEHREDARVVADTFDEDGYLTRVTKWAASDGLPYWDVYLLGYPDYETAAIVAMQASEADWDGDVLMLPALNELAPDADAR